MTELVKQANNLLNVEIMDEVRNLLGVEIVGGDDLVPEVGREEAVTVPGAPARHLKREHIFAYKICDIRLCHLRILKYTQC